MDLAEIERFIASVAFCMYYSQIEEQTLLKTSIFFPMPNVPGEILPQDLQEQQVYCFLIGLLSFGLVMSKSYNLVKDMLIYSSDYYDDEIHDSIFSYS